MLSLLIILKLSTFPSFSGLSSNAGPLIGCSWGGMFCRLQVAGCRLKKWTFKSE